jgi:membrane-associated protein
MSAFASLQAGSALSYLIALVIPALDAIIPVLPSETAVIALGVATAGSADPRIALLIGCAAAGAFLGDNLSYLLGRRFGPAIERRFFTAPKGLKARAWAERSLARYGTQLIIVCRFIPGGRTAVTLTCGLTGYPRRRFTAATAVAAAIWVLYAFFIGRIGGRAFEDSPWAGLAIAFGASIAISAAIEAIRRLRAHGPLPRRHAGQAGPDHAGQDQRDRGELYGRDHVAGEDHAGRSRPRGADHGPDHAGDPMSPGMEDLTGQRPRDKDLPGPAAPTVPCTTRRCPAGSARGPPAGGRTRLRHRPGCAAGATTRRRGFHKPARSPETVDGSHWARLPALTGPTATAQGQGHESRRAVD